MAEKSVRFVRVVFGWPPVSKLSANSRSGYRKQTPYKQSAFQEAYYLTKEYLEGRVLDIGSGEYLRLDLSFFTPDRISRDYDNVVTSMKTYQDGVFKALGVDDKLIKPGTWDWGEPQGRKKGGWVVFDLTVIQWVPLNYEEFLKSKEL